MEGLTGDVTAETVLAQMKAAADVPLWMAEGQTFTCDGSTVAIMPNVCSVSFFVGTLTEDGEVENPVSVDATPLFDLSPTPRYACCLAGLLTHPPSRPGSSRFPSVVAFEFVWVGRPSALPS